MYWIPVVMNATGFHTRFTNAVTNVLLTLVAWVGPINCEFTS